MTDESGSENPNPEVIIISDPKLYETLFNIVQDAQAAGSVVQIITIWPASSDGGPLAAQMARMTDCKPSGQCPK